jgi:hypothetical protein
MSGDEQRSLAALLLEPHGAPITAADLSHVRERVVRSLEPVTSKLHPGTVLTLDRHTLSTALLRPGLCSQPPEPFAPSASRCKRSIGLSAVSMCSRQLILSNRRRSRHKEHALARPVAPAEAVSRVLKSGEEDLVSAQFKPPWWAEWYTSLGRGARAVVQAEATTFATVLWKSIDWETLEGPPRFDLRTYWSCPPGRKLTLYGKADLSYRQAGHHVLLVLLGGMPQTSWRFELGFPALVASLRRGLGAAPGRVIGFWPASGQVRSVRVDAEMLETTAEAAVEASAVWVHGRVEARDRVGRLS